MGKRKCEAHGRRKEGKGRRNKNEALDEICASQFVNLYGNPTDMEKKVTWPE
jgi:hypothetical protein